MNEADQMRGPLTGVRVMDLSIVTAGGGTTQLLADFGADVIKVEGPDHADLFRHWEGVTGSAGGPGDLDSAPFRTVNRNKRGISINLKHPRGLELALRLARVSDIVVENFRCGVLDRIGLGFRELASVNRKIVLLSLSSQGTGGPESQYGSYGSSLDALGGLMSITGYDADTPTWSGNQVNYPDQVVSLLAPSLAVAGIMAARREQRAVWIDLSQREVVTALIGEWVLVRSLSCRGPSPNGNAGLGALEWCSRCAGDDEWITVSLYEDNQRRACCYVVGLDPQTEYSDDEIRRALEEWTLQREKFEASRSLQSAGVPASAVMKGWELLTDSYLLSRGFFQTFEVPGRPDERQRGRPVSLDDGDYPLPRRRAPHVGEHTVEVLLDLLGCAPDEVDALLQDGVVACSAGASVTVPGDRADGRNGSS